MLCQSATQAAGRQAAARCAPPTHLAAVLRRTPAGRRLLLDCGTSTYNTGLKYLVQRYRQVGVEFDEVSAGPAAAQPSPPRVPRMLEADPICACRLPPATRLTCRLPPASPAACRLPPADLGLGVCEKGPGGVLG